MKKATTDEKQIAKAKIVGEMIRKVGYSSPVLVRWSSADVEQENGVAKAIEVIYRDLVRAYATEGATC